MGAIIDPRSHIGETHGIYTIFNMLDETDKYGHWIYESVCNVCGYIKISTYGGVIGTHLTTNCKHLRVDGTYKDCYNVPWKNKRISKIFKGMIRRCYNKNDKDYCFYGERGIKICTEWLHNPHAFENWSLINGYNNSLTIDRIDSTKDYSPENCRWITLENNSKYKSTTSLIDVDGEIHTGRDWARNLGLNQNLINTYIRKYGLKNIIEFIRIYKNSDKSLKPKSTESYYSLYMNNKNERTGQT